MNRTCFFTFSSCRPSIFARIEQMIGAFLGDHNPGNRSSAVSQSLDERENEFAETAAHSNSASLSITRTEVVGMSATLAFDLSSIRSNWGQRGRPIPVEGLLADTAQPHSRQTRAICELRVNGSVEKAIGGIGPCNRDLAGRGVDPIPCSGRGVARNAEG
jgi:hypothetical protein